MKNTKTEDMKALKWRLSERPTVDNISSLYGLGVISKEEARQIILDEIEVDPVTIEDLQEEIKLLRKMVLELSERSPQTIVKIIEKEIEKVPYRKYVPYWINDYNTFYCSTTGNALSMVSQSPTSSGTANLSLNATTTHT